MSGTRPLGGAGRGQHTAEMADDLAALLDTPGPAGAIALDSAESTAP
ncbi:hypothetical protein [Streptomyces coeruleorubidus]